MKHDMTVAEIDLEKLRARQKAWMTNLRKHYTVKASVFTLGQVEPHTPRHIIALARNSINLYKSR